MCAVLCTYIAAQEADGHTQNEDGPEDMETLQHHHKEIQEVVSKERRVHSHWINVRRINDAEREEGGGARRAITSVTTNRQLTDIYDANQNLLFTDLPS